MARDQRVVRRRGLVVHVPHLAVDDRRRHPAVVQQRGVGGEAFLPHELLAEQPALVVAVLDVPLGRDVTHPPVVRHPPSSVFLQSASRAFSISVANVSTTAAVPAEYAELVDDAAIFPPGDAPLPDAVARHREHRRAAYAAMVGPFVVSDVRLPELLELLASDGADGPLAISVVVTGGAGGLAPAVAWATGSSLVELRGLEVALRDLDDLPGSARRVVAAAADLGTEAPVHVEPPVMQEPGHGWMTALDDIAAADLRLKFRT